MCFCILKIMIKTVHNDDKTRMLFCHTNKKFILATYKCLTFKWNAIWQKYFIYIDLRQTRRYLLNMVTWRMNSESVCVITFYVVPFYRKVPRSYDPSYRDPTFNNFQCSRIVTRDSRFWCFLRWWCKLLESRTNIIYWCIWDAKIIN